MRTLTIVSLCCAWVVACSDSDNAPSATNVSGGSGGAADAGAPVNKSGETSSAALDVVVNEVAAVGGTEWIEIANKGQRAVDLGEYSIADSDKTTNEPKKNDAMRFPTGTMIDPGGRILILASKKQGTIGPHPKADCLPDGPETCFHASFGVSATSGEALHLLAPDGAVVTSTAMPKTLSADAGGSTTETQCRVPDLTGEFVTCAATPGQPNRTP